MPRTFVAKLEGREASIEIEPAGPSLYRVRADGVEQTIDARRLKGGLSLLIEGKNYEVSLSRTGDDFDVLLDNRRFRFRLLSEERARRAAARGGAEVTGRREVKASMPGKVIAVLVGAGDRVNAKQGLLVIEAMKMENEIKSQGAGEVKEVRVQPGQAVESGEVLVVLE
ncbi:MAG: acetyl-CoA carboxylase biotin carboxyl carrier protein subunit [Deltaproteobacteria bacterium]|nr:acetyl-CoA carboxylase biotin carboxyl carrier protein subunit [Deltaproteobacteria bacterium]